MSDKKKTVYIFIGVILLVLLIVVATYAYLVLSVNVTNGNYVGNLTCFNILYDMNNDGSDTQDITGTLWPSSNYSGGLSGNVSIGIDESCRVIAYGNIYMKIDSVSSVLTNTVSAHCEDSRTLTTLTGFSDSSSCTSQPNGVWVTNGTALKYAFFDSDSSDPIKVGYITGTGTINLLKEFTLLTTPEKYYIYIWLDGNLSDNSYKSLQFDGYIYADANQGSKPEYPRLDYGMIPVTISDTGVTTTISSDNPNWYNYENKQWANAILVTSDSRSNYLGTDGVTVEPSDILAYYVWIPRYKYQIWTTSTSSTGSEQTIKIEWEPKRAEMTNGSTVGEYRTHPAFWWDNDSDGVVDSGEMLSGIWVGKFEATGDETTPTVLPDKTSLREQNVSTQFTTSLKFSGGTLTDGIVTYVGSDTYGLTTKTNSHMMKNSEWGAVAYLSHSIYGANREIYINNSSSYYTGRSGGNVGGSTAINTVYTDQTSTTQYNSYGFYTWDGYLLDYDTNTKGTTHDITKVASTTGNITGIYDMSGGAWEYVMGVLADDNGNPRSGYNTSINSGFNGIINENNTEYTSGISFPTSNYYDLYTSTSSTTACNGGICYGHALSETTGWYGDYALFVSSSYPWFIRGATGTGGASAGAFDSDGSSGIAHSVPSWRSVLFVGDGR